MANKVIVAENGMLRARSPYDQSYTVPSDVAGPTSITLPLSATYESSELQVELNGQGLRLTDDYTFVGSPPRTQISVLQDLKAGDVIRFRKVTNP